MNAPAATPPPAAPATPRSQEIVEQGKKARKDSVKAMFADQPEPPAPAAVPPSEPAPAVLPTPAHQEPEPPNPLEHQAPIIDDSFEDFEQRPASKAKAAEPEPEKPEEREERSITTLREQLGIQGRRAKELEMTLVERDLKLKALEEEAVQLRAELEKPSRAAKDPMSVKSIREVADKIVGVRDGYMESLKGGARNEFAQNFESMLRDRAAIANEQNPQVRDELIDKLQDRIGIMVGDDRVEKVMEILRENSGTYVNMRRMIDNIGNLAEEEEIQSKVTSWDDSKAKAAHSINSIADVNDEFIAANPNSPSSFVAKMVKEDPAYKERADKVKLAVIEAFNGKRPLTREEMQRLKENEEVSGVKISDFLKERGKREEANRMEMMKRAYIATMLLPELPDILAESAKSKQSQAAKEQERAALLGGVQERTTPAGAPGEHVRAQDRPSAVSNVLETMKRNQ